jgi:hypothetical protein
MVVHRYGTHDTCSDTPVQGFGARVNRCSTRVNRCATRRNRGVTAVHSPVARMNSGEMAMHSRGAACDSRGTAMHSFVNASKCVRCRYHRFVRTFRSSEHDENCGDTVTHCAGIAIDSSVSA